MSFRPQRPNKLQARAARKERRKERRAGNDNDNRREQQGYAVLSEKQYPEKRRDNFHPKTQRQAEALDAIRRNVFTMLIGPAGTGKTRVALSEAVDQLIARQIDQLVLTKPFFEIDEPLGILPGGEDEKTAPLQRSMTQQLVEMMGQNLFDLYVKRKQIIFAPLSTILGLNFNRCFVFIDETQNTTVGQMKALLTRTGENTTVVAAGDYRDQKFIQGRDGLEDAVRRFRGEEGVAVITFRICDIVRSGFCKLAVTKYRNVKNDEDEE